MPRDPKFDVLFEPIRIGSKVMKNRFYQTPHCTGFGSDRPGTQAFHRAVKAEGGWAVVNTEWCSIHPESDEKPAGGATLWDDDDLHNLSLMVERVHDHEALAGIELGYNGPNATNYDSRLAARGVSHLRSEGFFTSSFEMSKGEIRELQSLYVTAAHRARAAGFDIVNIMGSETACIPQQFLMSLYNRRRDEYGGSFENRARFWLELLEAVREAVGDTCAITTRFCIDTLHNTAEGIRVEEEGVGFIELADHLVDFWDLQVGGPTMADWGEDAGPSRFFPENFQRAWLARVRPHTAKPIVGVGRFTNPDTMVAAIASGQLDIIGAARPSIADPFLPNKIRDGRFDDIRECIGCNICISRHEQATTIICTQNPTVGEEYRRGWHPERVPALTGAAAAADFLVVGAGPAGLECALTLARRGAGRVHLVDSAPEVGGAMSWMSRLPGLGEWSRVVTWRTGQLAKQRTVEVILETQLTSSDVLDYGADVVVLATGASWSGSGLNPVTHRPISCEGGRTLTPEEVMRGDHIEATSVVVYDCDGYFVGPSIAEKLARDGNQVVFVTSHDTIAPYMHFTLESRRMHELLIGLGVTLIAHHAVSEVFPDEVRGYNIYARDAAVSWSADAVVFVTQRLPNDGLYRELEATPEKVADHDVRAVHRIGSCVTPRLIADSVFDGHRLAREIDSPDARVAKPYIRERRVLGFGDDAFDDVLGATSDGFRPRSALTGGGPSR